MARRSRQKRDVELFNFSFLDILACVIGLLIFILSIVVVSGGKQSRQQSEASASRLSRSKHDLEDARAKAEAAASRRANVELILNRQANDVLDPAAAADSLKSQIHAYDDESANLSQAAASAADRAHDTEAKAAALGKDHSLEVSTAAMLAEAKNLNDQADELASRSAEVRKSTERNIQHVNYSVPVLRETHRGANVWIEITGGHIWCLKSVEDYDTDRVDSESIRYTRRLSSPGVAVGDFVADRSVPLQITLATPDDTVLDVAVHDDAYAAFRQIREWAWKKGFAVNWHSQDNNPIVLTRTNTAVAQ